MKSTQSPSRSTDAVTLEFGGEAVIYHLRTGEVHRLDRIGSIIWNLLDGQTPFGELVPDLAAAFNVDPDVVLGHVELLLDQLGRAFLLAAGPAPPSPSHPRLLSNPPSP